MDASSCQSEEGKAGSRTEQIEEEELKTISVLQSCHCCKRCVLRYLGRRTIYVYSDPVNTCPSLFKSKDSVSKPDFTAAEPISNSEDIEQPGNTSNDCDSHVCPACLGILEELCDEKFIHKVCNEIHDSNYEFQNFLLSLTLPQQLDIRQHCLLSHLNEVCGSSLRSFDITSLKEVYKWVCGPMISRELNVSFHPKSSFEVGLTFEHDETKGEVDKLLDDVKDKEPPRKRHRFKRSSQSSKAPPTKQIISTALRCNSVKHLKEIFQYPPQSPHSLPSHTVECLHEPVLLAGRYTKYSRQLSQTPWVVDGHRKTEYSVEEYICQPIQDYFSASDYKFSSSGREDVDVRTLGRGRPFVVEIINPHKCVLSEEDLKKLQEKINTGTTCVGVKDLQVVGKDATLKLKEGETEKRKSYQALVRVVKSVQQEDLDFLSDIKDCVLKQKTPLRVLHRRPLATRERTIHSMATELVDEHHFKLNLCTQAGTYIKEFVHGDLGRTQPNLGTLMNTEADILELDVTAVHVDWPKKLDD